MEQMSKMTIGDSTYEVVDAQARKDIAALEIPTKVSELINDSGYLTEHQDLTEYAMKSEIPSRTSEIVNDTGFLTEIPDEYVTEEELRAMGYLTQVPSEYVTETELDGKGFLTEHQDLSEYAKTSTIPTKVSQLTNDAGYLKNVPSEYVTDTELNAKGYLTEHQSLTDYAKKTDIPVVPTKTSQLTNDSGFLTQHQSLSGYAKTVDHYTKTESDNKYQPKGSYLTAIPSEYVTDTELTGKGYAKQTEVDQLSEEIVDQQNTINQHSNQILNLAQGTPLPAESLEWLAENGDTSKIYLLPNGNLAWYTKGEAVENVNMIPSSVGTDGNAFGTNGILNNNRWGSSGSTSSAGGYNSTGLIAVSAGDVVTLENCGLYALGESGILSHRIIAWNTSKTVLGYYQPWTGGNQANIITNVVVDDNDEVTQFTVVNDGFIAVTGLGTSSATTLGKTTILDSNSAIYVNYSEGGSSYAWIDSEIKYANHVLTDADKQSIAQKVLDTLEVSYVAIDNTISVGTYTLQYEGVENTETIGEVTT